MQAFDALKDKPIWIAWNDENGRKVPKSPFGGNAKVSDPSTWGTYAQASAIANSKGYTGVGILITDGLVGIDLDHVVENGVISAEAQEIIDSIGSYTEYSPSGTGVHILAFADGETIGSIGRRTTEFEIYNYGRYFTVTGNSVNDYQIMDATSNVAKFISERLQSKTDDDTIKKAIADKTRDLARRKANETVRKTAEKNRMKWARVNSPTCTCGFCLMLASRGFIYKTKQTAGGVNPDHYHASCKCTVIAGYDGDDVEGYDPDGIYKAYYRPVYESLGKYNGLCAAFDSMPEDERDEYVLNYARKFGMKETTNMASSTYDEARHHWATYQVAKGVTKVFAAANAE